MKNACLSVFSLLLCVLYACKKDSKDPAPPDNIPLQLVKKIVRNEFNGQVTTDSTAYAYDDADHLIAITNLKTKQLIQKYAYVGDALTAVYSFSSNGSSDTVKSPVKYLDGGNTIFMDFTRHNGNRTGFDTVQVTYKWSGDQLLEAWTYLNIYNAPINLLQKTIITYNSTGNEFENKVLNNGTTTLQYRALAYDQKKNFFNTTSRLNYIFMGWGFPYASRSVNNPIKAEDDSGQHAEYVWTYNQDDYPLTMQIKGKNYLSVELTYNK